MPEGYVLINSAKDFDELGLADLYERHRRDRLVTVPATDIAREKLGRPIPNAALLGGFLRRSAARSRSSPLARAIREKFPGKIGEGNVAAAEAACEQVREQMREVTRA